MKRFLIFVILLLSLSAVFATEEQVFAAIETIIKELPNSRLKEILQDNLFIPLPSSNENKITFQNFFDDSQVKAHYYIVPNKVYDFEIFSIVFTFYPNTNKDFTEILQKLFTRLDASLNKIGLDTFVVDTINTNYEHIKNDERYKANIYYKLSNMEIILNLFLYPTQK